jgi:transketolase
VRQSICYPNLNVKLVASHSGLTVGEDGASHQALEDITLMRVLPNMKVLAPADGSQTRAMVRYAARTPGPVYIRTSRPKSPIIYKEDYQYDPGQPDLLLPGQDVLIVTTGFLVQEALAAVELLAQEGYYPGLLNLHTIKPLPEEALGRIFADYKKIATFEEHSAYGGLGSAVAEYVSSHECKPVWVHGTREFGKSGSPKNLLKMYELDAPHIKSKVQEIFEQGR